MTLLERYMIATETNLRQLIQISNQISERTLKKWQLKRILEGKDEPLTLWQVKVLGLALAVDYKELIAGAAGYTGVKIKEARTKIPNTYKRRNLR